MMTKKMGITIFVFRLTVVLLTFGALNPNPELTLNRLGELFGSPASIDGESPFSNS